MYSIKNGIPRKYILIYRVDWSMTLSGVLIIFRAVLENRRPTKAIMIPLISANVIEVCTVSDISLCFPEA